MAITREPSLRLRAPWMKWGSSNNNNNNNSSSSSSSANNSNANNAEYVLTTTRRTPTCSPLLPSLCQPVFF